MHRKIIARILLVLGLILLTINIASYNILFSYSNNMKEYTETKLVSCASIYESMDENVTYIQRGKSISANRLDTWYDIYGCENKLVYARISKPLYMQSTKAIVLVHDYSSDQYSLIGLMMRLVSHGYIVLQVGLPSKSMDRVKLLSRDYRNSWIYSSVCDIRKTITLLTKEYHVDNIGIIGIGFGGIVALLTAMYDDRVDYAVSITGYGDYRYSIGKASLLNYYVENSNDLIDCLDPVYLISETEKPVLIIIGTNDEINPINPVLLNKLIENPNIIISIIPNGNRYHIPLQWEDILLDFINNVSNNTIGEKPKIKIVDQGFEIIVETPDFNDISILAKPLIPGIQWSNINPIKERIRLTYFVLPGSYIIVNKENYRVYGYYVTRESFGIIIALILILTWIVLEHSMIIDVFKRISYLEVLYIISLLTLLFYTSYPCLLSPNRYHVSLNILGEIYARSLPFISYIVILSLILQPIILVYMLSKHERKAYSLYVGIPLFTIMLIYTFMLFIGFRFYYVIPIIPSTTLIPITIAIVLDYVLGKEL